MSCCLELCTFHGSLCRLPRSHVRTVKPVIFGRNDNLSVSIGESVLDALLRIADCSSKSPIRRVGEPPTAARKPPYIAPRCARGAKTWFASTTAHSSTLVGHFQSFSTDPSARTFGRRNHADTPVQRRLLFNSFCSWLVTDDWSTGVSRAVCVVMDLSCFV